MPWCPKCRAEYVGGFNTCRDCNCGLVDILDPVICDSISFLVTVNDEAEANIIESVLSENNIPVLKKNIVFGITNFDIDIYVPSRFLDEAKLLVNGQSEVVLACDVSEDVKSEKWLRNRGAQKILENITILIIIVAGFQVIYSSLELLKLVVSALGSAKLFLEPVYLLTIIYYVAILTIALAVFLGKWWGWYGFTSLNISLLLFNLILVLGALFFNPIREFLVHENPQIASLLPSPATSMANDKIIFSLAEIFIYGFTIILLFKRDVINSFNLQSSKIKLGIIVTLISIASSTIFIGILLLVAEHR